MVLRSPAPRRKGLSDLHRCRGKVAIDILGPPFPTRGSLPPAGERKGPGDASTDHRLSGSVPGDQVHNSYCEPAGCPTMANRMRSRHPEIRNRSLPVTPIFPFHFQELGRARLPGIRGRAYGPSGTVCLTTERTIKGIIILDLERLSTGIADHNRLQMSKGIPAISA